MRRKSIVFGILLILLALYMIVSRLGYAPAMPFFAAAFTIVFLYIAVRGFWRLHFTTGFLSLAILGCIHDELLQIEALTPWTLLLAGLLLGIAFDMIFKGFRKKHRPKDGDRDVILTIELDDEDQGRSVEDFADGQKVFVSNNFGSKSKYVNSDNFVRAEIENSFGECNVYFNNAVLGSDKAWIHAENHFGHTAIFLPSTWRVAVREESTFGKINVYGKGSSTEGAPLVKLELECNFGDLSVYFE